MLPRTPGTLLPSRTAASAHKTSSDEECSSSFQPIGFFLIFFGLDPGGTAATRQPDKFAIYIETSGVVLSHSGKHPSRNTGCGDCEGGREEPDTSPWPNSERRAGEFPFELPRRATSHIRGNHLARIGRLVERASTRLDDVRSIARSRLAFKKSQGPSPPEVVGSRQRCQSCYF